MNLLNFVNNIANSNFAFTILVVILIAVSLAMVYLIYSQNRDIKLETERRRQELSERLNSKPKEEIEEVIEENPVQEVSEDTIEDSLKEFQAMQEEVNRADFDGVPYNKVIPEYEEEPEEDNVTQEEYSGDIEDLQSITRELEILPREKTIELTPYEEEQESRAIISYDELVNTKSNDINYSNSETSDDVSIKQVDLEKTGNIEIERIKENVDNNDKNVYYHEEEFLSSLKDLQHKLLG